MTRWRHLTAWNEVDVWAWLHATLLVKLQSAKKLDWSGR